MGAAAGEGTDMVHLRCRCGLVVLQTHLAQGVLSDVAVPDCARTRHNVCPLIFGAARSTGSRSAPCSRGRRTAFWVSKAKHSSPDIAKAFKGLLPRRLFTFFHAISIPCKADKCVRDFGHHVFPNKRMANLANARRDCSHEGFSHSFMLLVYHVEQIHASATLLMWLK